MMKSRTVVILASGAHGLSICVFMCIAYICICPCPLSLDHMRTPNWLEPQQPAVLLLSSGPSPMASPSVAAGGWAAAAQ